MLLKDFIAEGVASLRDLYPEEEARSLVLMLCAAKLGVQRYTHLIEPQTEIPPGREEELSEAMERLRREHVAFDSAAEVRLVQGLPDSLLGRTYYRPTEQGLEGRFKARLEQIKAWKRERQNRKGRGKT